MKLCKLVVKTTPFLVIGLILAGCGEASLNSSNQAAEEPVVKVDTSEDEIAYSLTTLSTGEVTLTQNISCSYVQTKEQEVAFLVGGKIVDKVYVKEGDVVYAGDLLVELDAGNLEEEIAELEYNIKKSELQYGYLDSYETFDANNAYFNFVSNTDKDEDALAEYEKEDVKIKERYAYQREDFEDNLYFDREKLAQKKTELASNRVYATMTGTVLKIKDDLEGSIAKRGDVIMTVVDNSNGLFETKDESVKEYMKDGMILPMSVVYGNAKGDYELTPYQISSWGETQTFQIVDGPENAALEVGTSGTILATVAAKDNVLRIPREALYEADGTYYTYTLDEDNMRQVCFLEIGLVGDRYAEVISGITEDQKVIRK